MDELITLVADASVARIVLASGTYSLAEELHIGRDVAIEADLEQGPATLDGRGHTRVMLITAGRVRLSGLVITGGNGRGEGGGGGGVLVSNFIFPGVTLQGVNVTFERCDIRGNWASYGGRASSGYGGGLSVILMASGWRGRELAARVTLTRCTVRGNRAVSGGGLLAYSGTVVLSDSVVCNNSVTALAVCRSRAQYRGRDFDACGFGGGVVAFGRPHYPVNVELTSSTVEDNVAAIGGALVVFSGEVVMTDCRIEANHAFVEGGGLRMMDGTVSFTTTLVRTNTAPIGANLQVSGGFLYYALPIVPGHWLPNSNCVANRMPCDGFSIDVDEADACVATARACSLRSGSQADGWRPVIEGVRCKAPIQVQPCAWQTDVCANEQPECLLGKQVYLAPYSPIDNDFPNPCGIGYLGSNESAYQTSVLCRGLCPAGRLCPQPATLHPQPCWRGHFCPEGSAVARPCPAGTFSNATDLASADECTSTDPGFIAPAGSVAQSSCPAGFFTAARGGASCVMCAAGSYQNASGQTGCKVCERESYCPPGAAHPLGCTSSANIPNALTLFEGSSSAADCRCQPGYYDRAPAGSPVDCQTCPSGSDCSTAAGFTLTTLPIKRGYYRLHPGSIDVRRCPDASTNCSDLPECEESTSGCRGDLHLNATEFEAVTIISSRRRADELRGSFFTSRPATGGCYEDLTGVFCRVCKPRDDGKPVYYAKADKSHRARCALCRENARDTLLVLIGGMLALGLALFLLLQAWGVCVAEWRQKQFHRAWTTFKPHNKLKILIGFYMIATRIEDVYEVELPFGVVRILDDFSLVVTLGLSGLSSAHECLGIRGYIPELVQFMSMFPVLVLLIVLWLLGRMLCRGRCAASELLETSLPYVLQLGFLVYPIITNKAFEAFSCFKFTESQWLKADVTIQCGSPEHVEAKRLAWAAIAIYPVGMILVVSALLFKARRAILSRRHTLLSSAISFLYREFETQFFWWELVEMLRRFVLVGLMVLAQDSIAQLILGALLSAIFMLFQVEAGPYTDKLDDFLAGACSFGLVVMFLCSTAFKYMALTDLPDLQEKMSIEQRDYYTSLSSSTLTTIVVGCLFGTLAFSAVLLSIQLTIEGARLRREALVSRARRLRFKATNEEVAAPVLSSGSTQTSWTSRSTVTSTALLGYHLFLSHTWSSGQDQMRIVKQRLLEMIPGLRVFLDVDDLDEIGDLEAYITRTATTLVYCSDGYFSSRNCMRELVASRALEKPVVALIDLEQKHGGLSLAQVHGQLLEADSFSEKWGFKAHDLAERSTLQYHGAYTWPGGQALHDHLFSTETIEWNRIGHFQDVTMRLIAERLLPDAAGTTYVDRELISRRPKPLPPPKARFHVYCSAHNPGAAELMDEICRHCGFTDPRGNGMLLVTTDAADMLVCDHMLLYLCGSTWTRGDAASAALSAELVRCMDHDVHILLEHEMPGSDGKRDACEFDAFFSCADGTTPAELLSRGIYAEVAVPLKGGPWREASMVLTGMALGMSKEDVEDAKEGGDPLGIFARSNGALSVLILEAPNEIRRRISFRSRNALAAIRRLSTSVRRRRPEAVQATKVDVGAVSNVVEASSWA